MYAYINAFASCVCIYVGLHVHVFCVLLSLIGIFAISMFVICLSYVVGVQSLLPICAVSSLLSFPLVLLFWWNIEQEKKMIRV